MKEVTLKDDFNKTVAKLTQPTAEETHAALLVFETTARRNVLYASIARGQLYSNSAGTQREIAKRFNVSLGAVNNYTKIFNNANDLLEAFITAEHVSVRALLNSIPKAPRKAKIAAEVDAVEAVIEEAETTDNGEEETIYTLGEVLGKDAVKEILVDKNKHAIELYRGHSLDEDAAIVLNDFASDISSLKYEVKKAHDLEEEIENLEDELEDVKKVRDELLGRLKVANEFTSKSIKEVDATFAKSRVKGKTAKREELYKNHIVTLGTKTYKLVLQDVTEDARTPDQVREDALIDLLRAKQN